MTESVRRQFLSSEIQANQSYAEALSSIPGTVDQYLANKMQEAVDVAVQLKYDRFREESTSANQQFLDSIDEGMKKIIKDQSRIRNDVQDEQTEEEVQHLPDWFQKPTRLPSPDHAWNTSVPAVHETVQPWLSSLAQQDPRESADERHLQKLTELEYFCEEVYKATTEKLDWINPEVAKYPHDLGTSPLPHYQLVSKFSVPSCYNHSSLHQQRPGILLGGVVKPKVLYFPVTKTKSADTGHIKMDRILGA
ncbi:hypothetical protein Tco_1402948 [Tanacetum coccineum]